METNLEKAKTILGKSFCRTYWQANDAEQQSDEVMNDEEIKFLTSLEGITKENLFFFGTFNQGYDTKELFDLIQTAEEKNKEGILLRTTLTPEDKEKLKQTGYLIRSVESNSVSWDEVYFTEEAFIKAGISHLKSLFGDTSVAV